MKEKGKEIKMLSKAACAFSMGELRLFSLWFKVKSNKTHTRWFTKSKLALCREATPERQIYF